MHTDSISTQHPCGEFVVATNIGQALLPSLKQECPLRVVQTEQLENRGVEIVDVNSVFDGHPPRKREKFAGDKRLAAFKETISAGRPRLPPDAALKRETAHDLLCAPPTRRREQFA